jgi:pimeloyl-ACP methyl ester carboxylesterase
MTAREGRMSRRGHEPRAKWALFEDSSHMPHVEEHNAFLEAVESFLRTID